MKKKLVSIVLMTALAAGTLAGCGGQGGSGTGDSANVQTGGDAQGSSSDAS